MTFDLFITLFLVFLNGFFVAAEFAIVKVRSSQIALEKGRGQRAKGRGKGNREEARSEVRGFEG